MMGDFNFWMFALHTLMAVTAGFHLVVITADKYFVVRKPLRHQLNGIFLRNGCITWGIKKEYIMFYDVTIIYAQVCNLIIFFAKRYVLG